jgi:ubiquinone/menaquinone biosynthesis C-methylase UbiE
MSEILLSLINKQYEMHDDIVFVKSEGVRVSTLGESWDSLEDAVPRGWLFHVQFLKELYFLRKIKPGHIVLDLGCGKAALMERMYKDGIKASYIGIDASESALRHRIPVAKKFNALLVKYDFSRDVCIRDSSIDLVVFSEVIEHFPKEEGIHLLTEIRRILKPGGVLLLTTSILRDQQKAGHITSYESKQLAKMWLPEMGFEVVNQYGLYLDDEDYLTDNERDMLLKWSEFYPRSFMKSLLALHHAEMSRSFLIEAKKV